jgi:hypothetical protein
VARPASELFRLESLVARLFRVLEWLARIAMVATGPPILATRLAWPVESSGSGSAAA